MKALWKAVTAVCLSALACFFFACAQSETKTGESAYEIWLENGHEGPETDFLNWLKGADGQAGAQGPAGQDGKDGLSAYELFVKYNPDYLGSEEDWVNDLANGRLAKLNVTFDMGDGETIVRNVFYNHTLPAEAFPAVPEKANAYDGKWSITENTKITENIVVQPIYSEIGFSYTEILFGTAYEIECPSSLPEGVTELIIPSEYNGKPVTAIGALAFKGGENVKKVTVPDSVTFIHAQAFSCPAARKTEGGVTYIDGWAIGYDGSVSEVSLRPDARGIAAVAFHLNGGNLTKISVPDSVRYINLAAFWGCENLAEVSLGNGAVKIGPVAFAACKSLRHVALPDGVTAVEISTFSHCENLESVVVPASVTEIKNAFGNCSALHTVYYGGTAEDYAKIDFAAENDAVLTADKICYFSKDPPTGTGKYWHYENGIPVMWQ